MYHLFCDGSAIYNPYRGGWGFILKGFGRESWANGFVDREKINRMELMAVVEGLDRLADPSTVEVYTDSVYVIVGAKRRRQGELWARFLAHRERHELKLNKVKTHPDHTRAHNLARDAAFTATTEQGGRSLTVALNLRKCI